MANLNRVHIIGNLCRDPEVRYTPGGTAVGDLSVATNRKVKDTAGNYSDETTFLDVTVWGQSAEYCQKYLAKGASVFIEGRLQLDTWEDKTTREKRSKLKVVAESVQGLGKPSEKGQGDRSHGPGRDVSAAEAMGKRDNGGGAPSDIEDDIPFAPYNPPF